MRSLAFCRLWSTAPSKNWTQVSWDSPHTWLDLHRRRRSGGWWEKTFVGYILFANLVWPQHPGLQEATMKRQEQEQADGVCFPSDLIRSDDMTTCQIYRTTPTLLSNLPTHTHPTLFWLFPPSLMIPGNFNQHSFFIVLPLNHLLKKIFDFFPITRRQVCLSVV